MAEAQSKHGAPVPGVSERELRQFETRTLGQAHAAEHAQNRTAQRQDSGGANAARAAAAPPANPREDWHRNGKWESPFPMPVFGVHAAMLPTGKVLWFSYPNQGSHRDRNTASAWLWDPKTRQTKKVDPPLWQDPAYPDQPPRPVNIWCAGHAFDQYGRLVVFGGNLELPRNGKSYRGLDKIFTFDPFAADRGENPWTEEQHMNKGRWYPTGVRRPDGSIPILSGWDESGDDKMNEEVELFTPGAQPGAGRLEMLGSTLPDWTPQNDDGTTPVTYTQYYPHLFSMASGRTLVAGPDQWTWFLNRPGSDTWGSRSNADMARFRLWGTAVPLADDSTGQSRVLQLGGRGNDQQGNQLTTTAEQFDERQESLGWQTMPAEQQIARAHSNTVLLPDESMLQVGGGTGQDPVTKALYPSDPEQRQVELWDPKLSEWRLGAAQTRPRAYHSTALLLPDATVVSAGDDRDWDPDSQTPWTQDVAEIYKPPYLFNEDGSDAARPTIDIAPATAPVGGMFGVKASSDATKAVLVSPAAVTHATDMSQSRLPLAVTASRNGCVDIQAPPTVEAAPPGYYMLFLLNEQGVPSEAKFVSITRDGQRASTCAELARDPGPGTGPSTPTGPGSVPSNPGTGTGSGTPSKGTTTPAKPAKPAPTVRFGRIGEGALIRIRRGSTLRVPCRATGSGRRSCLLNLHQILSTGKTRRIGTGRATLASGKREGNVSVKLSPSGLAALRKARRPKGLGVRLDARVTDLSTKRSGAWRQRYRLTR